MSYANRFLSILYSNKHIIISVLAGFGVGFFIRDIFLWKKKEEGYLKEIYREVFELKAEVSQLKSTTQKSHDDSYLLKRDFDLDTDIYEDAEDIDTDDNSSFYSFSEEFSDELDAFVLDFDKTVTSDVSHFTSQCYEICRSVSWKYQDFAEFLWRYSMATYFSTLTDDIYSDEKQQRHLAAFEYVTKAYESLPNSSEVNKWLGVLYGVVGLYGSNREKIKNGKLFKDHIDRCLELNPKDSYAYLLRGRFCYQVYNLSYIERNLAALLFEQPPIATIEEAIQSFQKCEELCPNFYASNHYYLSLCYKSLSKYDESEKWIQSAKQIPITLYDHDVKEKLENSI